MVQSADGYRWDWPSTISTIGASLVALDERGNWIVKKTLKKEFLFGIEMWVPTQTTERTLTYAP
jgi:hypothetical protein